MKRIKKVNKKTAMTPFRKRILVIFVLLLLIYPNWQPIAKSSTVVPNRIVAVGDLHGDLKNTLATFKMARLIDSQRNWIAGNTILVQTGDVVDRGDDTIELYKLMMKLQMQANEAGGSVLSLLGNHEVMNVNNDLRYVSQGDYDSFGGSEKRKQAWSQNGWLGKYIRKLKITAWVNGTVFFHGG